MISEGVVVGVHLRPCFGEIVSGDTVVIVAQEATVFLAIADVLGHGPEAHVVAERIAAFLRENVGPDLTGLMEKLHEQLKGSLGAAVGLGYLEKVTGRFRYVGIGNTRMRRFGSVETRLISRDGTVGAYMRTLAETQIHLEAGDLLLLTTDGVKEHFTLDEYSGLLGDSPAVVARQVIKRFGKEHDDATCMAVRYRP